LNICTAALVAEPVVVPPVPMRAACTFAIVALSAPKDVRTFNIDVTCSLERPEAGVAVVVGVGVVTVVVVGVTVVVVVVGVVEVVVVVEPPPPPVVPPPPPLVLVVQSVADGVMVTVTPWLGA